MTQTEKIISDIEKRNDIQFFEFHRKIIAEMMKEAAVQMCTHFGDKSREHYAEKFDKFDNKDNQ